MTVQLTKRELEILFSQDPQTKTDGGFQCLLVNLQGKVDRVTGDINLDKKDLERIPRYAFDYKQGGWENMLMRIFSRVLGIKLGR